MHPPANRPLPPAALRVLAVAAENWGLCLCARLPAIRTRMVLRVPVQGVSAELREWPYWPDYPGAAVGWR